jgi:uncharacterized DUF497 family protein
VPYWWADWNRRKVRRHRLTPEEVEQAREDPDAVPTLAYPGPDGWERDAVVGMTRGGALVVVVWEVRPDDADPDAEPWVVIVTAYKPAPWQIELYRHRGV